VYTSVVCATIWRTSHMLKSRMRSNWWRKNYRQSIVFPDWWLS